MKRPDPRRALRRLQEYARATGVRFVPTARHAGWQELGLPDLRGFTPHLRAVRRFAGEPAEFPRAEAASGEGVGFDELDVAELWLLHDLAHVIWYDAASAAFGIERWAERDFFLEHHLASEAFAVLLVDYHLLAFSRHRGLAVELDAGAWSKLCDGGIGIPPLDSWEMCRELVAQYLAGEGPLFRRRFEVRGESAATLARWREHELSYSDKQRWYVFLWWDDLNGAPLSNRKAIVEDPTIAELVWLTLRHFTCDPEAVFAAHVARVARVAHVVSGLAGVGKLFAALPKYGPKYGDAARDPRELDFRFTDLCALPPERVSALLAKAHEPTAATLFLLWQALALTTPDRLTDVERAAVGALARSVQTPAPDLDAWRAARSIGERVVAAASWTPDPALRSAFFLP